MENRKANHDVITINMGEEYGILLSCKSFYYVYQQLYNQTFFSYANESMEEKIKRFDSEMMSDEGRPLLFPALVTNGCLAAELALKYLIAKENRVVQKGHYLSDLYFNQLPPLHRQNLDKQLFHEAHQNEETLQSNLAQYDKHFENARYFYEKGSIGVSGFFNDFVKIVCEYAISTN